MGPDGRLPPHPSLWLLGSFPVTVSVFELVCFFSQVSPWDKREEATEKKLGFAGNNSDHIALLKAYKVQSALALVLTGNKKKME